MTLFVLLPSPFLGPRTWEPVAEVLRVGGDAVTSPVFAEPAPAAPHDALAELVRAVPEDRKAVLVAHSNAGYYVPAIAAARQVLAAVFVDAALPPFDAPRTRVTNPSFLDFLTERADAGGLLPVWTDWWGADLSELFPDRQTQAAVEQQQRRFPLTYFSEELDVPPGWTALPCAYLAFGGTYSKEVEAAQERGWPASSLAGGHLEMLIQPGAVATELHRLLEAALERTRR